MACRLSFLLTLTPPVTDTVTSAARGVLFTIFRLKAPACPCLMTPPSSPMEYMTEKGSAAVTWPAAVHLSLPAV